MTFLNFIIYCLFLVFLGCLSVFFKLVFPEHVDLIFRIQQCLVLVAIIYMADLMDKKINNKLFN